MRMTRAAVTQAVYHDGPLFVQKLLIAGDAGFLYTGAMKIPLRTIINVAVLVLLTSSAGATTGIKPFSSDGCSLFPDGTVKDRARWCDCCFRHDIAYWQGGTEDDRKKADEGLRDCVLERTQDKALAETMYIGVRAGGHPVFPNWYRWAYGWPYGRGYKPLSDAERQQVVEQLDAYSHNHPAGYCAEKHPASAPAATVPHRPAN